MNPFKMGWLGQSFASLIFVIPCWLAVGFFEHNYQVRGGVFMLWFFQGVVIGGAVLQVLLGHAKINDILVPNLLTTVIFFVGVYGSLTNHFLFEAVARAINKGLPVAIQSTSAVFLPLIGIFLYWLLPKYFPQIVLGQYQMVGIVITLIGLFLMTVQD